MVRHGICSTVLLHLLRHITWFTIFSSNYKWLYSSSSCSTRHRILVRTQKDRLQIRRLICASNKRFPAIPAAKSRRYTLRFSKFSGSILYKLVGMMKIYSDTTTSDIYTTSSVAITWWWWSLSTYIHGLDMATPSLQTSSATPIHCCIML